MNTTTKRTARCSYFHLCGNEAPSDYRNTNGFGLPFFEFLGEGSAHATEKCVCGYSDTVHQQTNPHTGREGITDHAFEPRGASEFDRYYCGCRGWD